MTVVFFDLGETLVTAPRRWLPGARELLRSLQHKGLRLGVISNTGDLQSRQEILDLLPPDFEQQPFESSLLLFSSEVGTEKPDRAIFEAAVARAAVDVSECLYCSENVVETLMAQQVGLLTVRVQTAPHSDLGTLGRDLDRFLALA